MKAPDDAAGKSAKCPACGKAIAVTAKPAEADEVEVVEDDELEVVEDEAPAENSFDFPEKSNKKKKKRKKKKHGLMTKEEEQEMYDKLRANDARRNRIIINSFYALFGVVILAGGVYMWTQYKKEMSPLFSGMIILTGVAAIGKGLVGLIFGHYFNPYFVDED